MAGVFISYRRDDSAGWAGRLATDLLKRFGAKAVFQDIGAIGAGEDFVTAIERALGSCPAVLVLIGPDWSTIKDKGGSRRLDDPSDTVRLELAKALQREGVLVIPVLLGGASMPEAGDLPDELEPLARRNALELSDKRWNYDLERLAETLEKTAGLKPVAKPDSTRGTPPRATRLFAVLGVVGVVSVAVLGYFWLDQPDRTNIFEVFSIDRPANDEELPLGKSQTWMLEGKLRVVKGLSGSGGTPTIDVEVFRLPDRQSVSQSGKVRISTERSLWRFESARFSGEGTYEVLATVSLGGRSDWRSVIIKCIQKETAFQRAIEKDRAIRGVTTLGAVTLNSEQLADLKRELHGLQSEFFQLFPDDLEGAEANVTRTLDLLDPVLPAHPNDQYLQNVRAYTFKNYAMVMRNRGREKEFDRAVREAERMFETIREQNPDDPGAWNGLGSVALLQGDPGRALVYIDRALELKPDYQAAKHDRAIAVRMLKQREGIGANRTP